MEQRKYANSPFQWAGGKNKVLPVLLPVLEKYKKKVFCEPFVGAANVALNFDADRYILSDYNQDLIYSFIKMRDDVETYLSACEALFTQGFDVYYNIREQFNAAMPRERSAMFQYLNKHGFNGLCRYNSKGQFNVPIGTSTKPKNVPTEQILHFNKRFNEIPTQFQSKDFVSLFNELEVMSNNEVLIYCDPPYVPLTSDFKYTADGFDFKSQIQLRDLAQSSKHTAIISNHFTEFTANLYKDADELIVFDVQRTISCKGNDRKRVQECVAVYKKGE
jgi:DNA adenine methylase